MAEMDAQAPYLPENLWGYGKRLRFVDSAIRRAFPGKKRCELGVLDVGCGNGSQLAIPLANAGYQLTAIDPHYASIQRGRGLAPEVKFIHGQVSDLSLTKFDCVIISEVLEHLEAPEVFCEWHYPILRNLGYSLSLSPMAMGSLSWIDACFVRFVLTDWLPGFGQH